MRGLPLVFQRLDNDCIIPVSHKLNRDGYFRYTDPRYEGKGRAPKIMYHRYVWEQHHGAIPEGYEIDHMCHNRACCNIEHLQCIPGTEHTIKHDKTRYADRQEVAKEYWLSNPDITGTALGEKLGVSFGAACKWIRKWKKLIDY